MKPDKNIEQTLEQLAEAIGRRDSFVDDVMTRIKNSPVPLSKKTEKRNLVLRRIFMKNTLKFTAAAVVLVAAVLSLTLLDKTVTPAYALEQTMQACHGVQYLHIKSFMASIPDEPGEGWIEFDQSGQVKNIRFHKPAWMDTEDGDTVIVWKDNKMQLWIKKKNMLATLKDNEMAAGFLSMVEQVNPKNAVENILKAQERGDTKVEISEPQNKTDTIIITADLLKKSDFPFQRVILFVDQATKLVNSLETYQLKDEQYVHFSTLEFYDYDMPIDPKMFALEDEVPADAIRMDQTTQEVGLPQGQRTNDEVAVEVVRQFWQAIIDKDYAKASQMYEGLPAAMLEKTFADGSKGKILEIVSVGPVQPHWEPKTGGVIVPCTLKIEENGQIHEQTFDKIGVRQVHGQPGRWTIFGGL